MFPYYSVFGTRTLTKTKYQILFLFFFGGPESCGMNQFTKMREVGKLYGIWGNKRPSPEIQLLLVRTWLSLNYGNIPAK